MARITVEDCIDKFPSRFELVLIASHRARKLHSGDSTTLDRDNDKNTVIALREIADSVFTVEQMKENLIQEYQTITLSDEEEENTEMELLDKQKDSHFSSADNVSKDEIEEEMKNLVSLEDNELENQYAITDNVDAMENKENNKEIE